MTYEGLAFAKINLYLDVLSKMENGYHNIESVMQSISLCDKITLDIENTDELEINILAKGLTIPNDKTNLIYRATTAFISYLNDKNDIKAGHKKYTFFVEKNIPVGAGMAGGSSDCACALKLLNEAYGFPLKDTELLSIGSKIGADVAFCLTGGTAICKGIGDKITSLPSLKDVFLVSAIDNSSVSTPEAFKMLDSKYGTNPAPYGGLEKMSLAVSKGETKSIAACLYNKFESVIAQENENVRLIKETLIENGALGALMSGSGPSVFGIFESQELQLNAFKALKSKEIRAFLCKTV